MEEKEKLEIKIATACIDGITEICKKQIEDGDEEGALNSIAQLVKIAGVKK